MLQKINIVCCVINRYIYINNVCLFLTNPLFVFDNLGEESLDADAETPHWSHKEGTHPKDPSAYCLFAYCLLLICFCLCPCHAA